MFAVARFLKSRTRQHDDALHVQVLGSAARPKGRADSTKDQFAENPVLPGVERRDVRLLKSNRKPDIEGSSRTILVNLTIPVVEPDGVTDDRRRKPLGFARGVPE